MTISPLRPKVTVLLGGDLIGADQVALAPIHDLAEVAYASTYEELDRQIADADVLLVWDFRFARLDDLLPKAPRLKWVHVAAVGVEALLTPGIVSGDIVVTNSRGVFEGAIAEYVLGLYLAHLKDLRTTLERQAARVWDHRLTRRLRGRTAAVIGTGAIGRETAALLAANGVAVELVGRREADDPEFGRIRASEDLLALAPTLDLLVLAAPLTAATRNMVDRPVLEALGPDAYLVNVGRGALVDQDALAGVLAAGGFAGAALDVFVEEPLPPSSPLWADPRVVVSPHMSADFIGFDAALVEVFLGNLRSWAAGGELTGVVDKHLGYVPSGA